MFRISVNPVEFAEEFAEVLFCGVQRTIIGTMSEACFLACLAAFLSLGVISGCFFDSLLLCLTLPMIVFLVNTGGRWCHASVRR